MTAAERERIRAARDAAQRATITREPKNPHKPKPYEPRHGLFGGMHGRAYTTEARQSSRVGGF